MASVTLHEGDNRETLRRLIDQGVRVHSVCTDPPYGLVSITKRFGKEGAAPALSNGATGVFGRSSKGFMGQCYHPETEILTKSGWKKIADVTKEDAVATLDPNSRNLVWQQVEQTHAYDFDGELVHIKHRSAEQMVTPNHNVLLSHDCGETLRLVEAGQIYVRKFHLFAQAAGGIGEDGDTVTIQSEREYGKDRLQVRQETGHYPSMAFFRFMGLWLGDGYTTTRTNDHPANDFFGLSVKKPRKIETIRSTLLALGITFKETPPADDGNTSFYCYDFALLGFLKTIGKAHGKFIPEWMFDWSAEHLEEMYQGLMETDGCRQGKNQEVYHTSSKQLADDFQRLCLQTGRSAISVFKPGGKQVEIAGRTITCSDAWSLPVLQPGKRMYCENGTGRGSDVMGKMAYAGPVHCVGVAEYHILYTRFNGKPVWSGNSWDGSGIERDPEFWRLIYDILLPGGYCVAFSGSRTGHWQACAMEMAGFIMHPMVGWVTGQGFPKAHNASKAIDRELGGSAPGSPEAQQWEGWAYGTQSLKPALEPIYMAQKPFSEKNGALNLLKHGVGAINIDGCRVAAPDGVPVFNKRKGDSLSTYGDGLNGSNRTGETSTLGRHPANLLHDNSGEVVALFPNSKGQQGDVRGTEPSRTGDENTNCYGEYGRVPSAKRDDGNGSAARFFNGFPLSEDDIDRLLDAGIIAEPDAKTIYYHPKAGKADRAGSKHPTVKPVSLMEWLVTLVTPPGGVVLDPFGGTGTTGQAATNLGFDAILMEAEAVYAADIRARFNLDEPFDLDALLGISDSVDDLIG